MNIHLAKSNIGLKFERNFHCIWVVDSGMEDEGQHTDGPSWRQTLRKLTHVVRGISSPLAGITFSSQSTQRFCSNLLANDEAKKENVPWEGKPCAGQHYFDAAIGVLSFKRDIFLGESLYHLFSCHSVSFLRR